MNSRLIGLRPVRLINMKDNTERRVPNPMWFSNISLLWGILGMVVHDWEREATPFQDAINKTTTDGERQFYSSQAFMGLQPCFLKCLFSYALFFVSLENAYDSLYAELNALNQETVLQVKHEKRPKRCQYIKKVRRIRNLSIAHLGSKKVSAADALAAMMWQPLTWGTDSAGAWNVDEITFREGKLVFRDVAGNLIDESADLKIKGIPEMHARCMAYIDEYDRICAEYLSEIKRKLPITVNDLQYIDFQAAPTGKCSVNPPVVKRNLENSKGMV